MATVAPGLQPSIARGIIDRKDTRADRYTAAMSSAYQHSLNTFSSPEDTILELLGKWSQRLVGRRMFIGSEPASVLTARSEQATINSMIAVGLRLDALEVASLHQRLSEAEQREQQELRVPQNESDVSSSELPPSFMICPPHLTIPDHFGQGRILVLLDTQGHVRAVEEG